MKKPLKAISVSQIEGIIKDSSGSPVALATVSLKDGYQTTASDEKGHFKLDINGRNSTLVISVVGYEQKELEFQNKEFLEIT